MTESWEAERGKPSPESGASDNEAQSQESAHLRGGSYQTRLEDARIRREAVLAARKAVTEAPPVPASGDDAAERAKRAAASVTRPMTSHDMLVMVSAVTPILLLCLSIWSWSAMRLYSWLAPGDGLSQVVASVAPAPAAFGAGRPVTDFTGNPASVRTSGQGASAARTPEGTDPDPRAGKPVIAGMPSAPDQLARIATSEYEVRPPGVVPISLISAGLTDPVYPADAPAVVQTAGFSPAGKFPGPPALRSPLERDEPPSVAGNPGIALAIFAPSALDPEQIRGVLTGIRAAGVESPEARPVGLAISSTQVRYYHEADRRAAERVASAAGATLRDFTTYSPEPPSGTVELWLAGKPRGTQAASSSRRPAVEPGSNGDVVLTRLVRSFWPLNNNQAVRVAVTRSSRQGGDTPAWSRENYQPQAPSGSDRPRGSQAGGASGSGSSGGSSSGQSGGGYSGGSSGAGSSGGSSSGQSGGGSTGGASGSGSSGGSSSGQSGAGSGSGASSAGGESSSGGGAHGNGAQRDRGNSGAGKGNADRGRGGGRGNGNAGGGDRGKSDERGGGRGGGNGRGRG
jgi:hypothetical protein